MPSIEHSCFQWNTWFQRRRLEIFTDDDGSKVIIADSTLHMRLVLLNSNTTMLTCGAGIAIPSGAPEFIPTFQWSLCCLIVNFLCNALWIVVRSFVLFLLAMVLSVLRFVTFNYPFDIFKIFLKGLCTLHNKTVKITSF